MKVAAIIGLSPDKKCITETVALLSNENFAAIQAGQPFDLHKESYGTYRELDEAGIGKKDQYPFVSVAELSGPSAARELVRRLFGFCGCGTDDWAEDTFRVMGLLDIREKGYDGGPEPAWSMFEGLANELTWFTGHKGSRCFSYDWTPYGYIILKLLGAHDLTEHGSSDGGSWLEEKGRALLECYKAEEKTGEYVPKVEAGGPVCRQINIRDI